MSIQALSYVIKHCEATRGKRCIMFAIANHADEHGENCWASVETLAHEARLSRRGAQEALTELRADGEIEAMGRSRAQTTVYRIVGMSDTSDQVSLDSPEQGSAKTAQAQEGGAETDTGGAQETASGGEATAPKPSRTVRRTDTPPSPPRGGRARNVARFEAEQGDWIADHFPAYEPGAVRGAMSWASKRHPEVSVETVQAELDRLRVEPREASPV